MEILSRLLRERPYLIADGATGTNYFAMGLETGDAPELWNLSKPEGVQALHRSFIDAGADILLTNTFGGSRHRLKLHGAASRVTEINVKAARLAREVVRECGREVVVAGDIGPTGELFRPLGVLDHESGAAAFAEQAQALAEGGADVIWIETMSSKEEVAAAVAGAATTGLPVVCTASFDTNGRTMMGLSPPDFARLCGQLAPAPIAYGANCGVGAAEALSCILHLTNAAPAEAVLIVKANCGVPEYVNGAIRYDGTPDLMADYARLALDCGVRIIGGCCGTTPVHIRAIASALAGHVARGRPTLDEVVRRLGSISTGARAQLEEGGREREQARRGRRRRAGG